jgi:hypothetical protein
VRNSKVRRIKNKEETGQDVGSKRMNESTRRRENKYKGGLESFEKVISP